MNKPYPLKTFAIFAWVCLAILLQACGNRFADQVTESLAMAQKRVVTLKTQLDTNQIRNALIVKAYADKLTKSNPELTELAAALKKDSTAEGPLYQNLITRLKSVKRDPENIREYELAAVEINNVYTAADPIVFNDALMDVVNTMSDLSNGTLPRINIPKTKTNEQAQKTTPGNHLVGNPSYGSWQTNSSGQSLWAWYGMYSMFSNLTGPRYSNGPIYQSSWYSRPHYSYYHDYGRSTYGSSRDRQSWRSSSQRLASQGVKPVQQKNYTSLASQKRVSAYGANRGTTTGSSRSSPAKSSSTGTTSKRASTYSSYSSSSRGTSRSRSSFGGK